MNETERKSELWTKFYEEEKSRLERELLQAVFRNNAATTSPIKSEDKVPPSISVLKPGSQESCRNTRTPPKSCGSDAMFESPSRLETNIIMQHQKENVIQNDLPKNSSTAHNRLAGKQYSSSIPPNPQPISQTNTIDKLHVIRNDLVQKWADEYVASSTNVKNMAPIQRHQLLEALMKMRGAVQTEHENLLRSQREALVKQADIELQSLVLQEQVKLERSYRDYVLSKLAQHIYNSRQIPVDLTLQTVLDEVQNSQLLSLTPSTLNTYLEQRTQRIFEECTALIDQYAQRKLSTAGAVLMQQHEEQRGVVSSSSTGQISSSNLLQETLSPQMQEDLQKEKAWLQERIKRSNQQGSNSLRTVEHELWQKGYLVFQRNVTLAGQIALLKQLQ